MFQSIGPFQIIVLAFVLALYLIPTILAFILGSRNKPVIILVNLLLGWIGGIGWAVALGLAIAWRSKSTSS